MDLRTGVGCALSPQRRRDSRTLTILTTPVLLTPGCPARGRAPRTAPTGWPSARPAAKQRGYWLTGQRAGSLRQLHDDRVLVDCGPDEPVLQRHLGTCVRLAHAKLGRTAPNPVAEAGVGVPGHVCRQQ